MKKVLFRDQPFYVDVYIHPTYNWIDSYIIIYIKRTSWLRCIFKYKRVCSLENISRITAQNKKTVHDLLKKAWNIIYSYDKVTECIECSPDVEALYAQEVKNQQ